MEAGFCKLDAPNRVAYAEVLVPDVADLQGDVAGAATIRDAAWRFLAERGLATKLMHAGPDPGHRIVESFLARAGDPEFTPGAWVVAIQYDPATWDRIRHGELMGLSIGGWGEFEEL